MKTRLAAVSFGLSVAAAVFLLVWPTYSGSDGTHTLRRTLVQMNGVWVVIPVMFPVVIALVPMLFRNQTVRIIAAIIMGAFAFIAGMSVGLFYAPAALFMLLAACVSDEAKLRDALP